MILICCLTRKKSITLKPVIKNTNFPTQFCLETYLKKFAAVEPREISFKGQVYDLFVCSCLFNRLQC